MSGIFANNRYTPMIDPTGSLTTLELIFVQNLALAAGNDSTKVPIISTGTTAPASTPLAVGDIYVDTTNKHIYMAAGTGSSADWLQVDGSVIVEDLASVAHPLGQTIFTSANLAKWIDTDTGKGYYDGFGYTKSGTGPYTYTMDLAPNTFIRLVS